jgi:hypothetical protein
MPADKTAQRRSTTTRTKATGPKAPARAPAKKRAATVSAGVSPRRLAALGLPRRLDAQPMLAAIARHEKGAAAAVAAQPEDVRASVPALRPETKRFHGAKVSPAWLPAQLTSPSAPDRFGYLMSGTVRSKTRLPFDAQHQALLDQLGDLMGEPGREVGRPDSTIPAGFTYVGQFVDHDITFDVTSSLDTATDATTVPNMRTPALDLDSLYGRGPALDPFRYRFPPPGDPPTGIKLLLGTNIDTGPGGPAGPANAPGGMVVKTDFDVPRMSNPFDPNATNTAVIGDPRNDENLIVSQLHAAMIRFHNLMIDVLHLVGFAGDHFVEAQRIVRHHYQWAVVNDFLKRVCGAAAVSDALAHVSAPVGSPFRMPVEFAVAAYRFGHSMIRDDYWVNFNFPDATLGQVFEFIRNPNLPVLSIWVVDFNAFFDTGTPVPMHNMARTIDSVLASGLETLPGFTGLMAVLAKRNLRRGLALGLPSGQGVAKAFGLTPLTTAQLTQGLPADEVALLGSLGGVLLQKTPLWYYVLREAAVLQGGNQLGPVGAKIVADTFVRMLKRDASSFLNATPAFVPFLPAKTPGDFTFADLLNFCGATKP